MFGRKWCAVLGHDLEAGFVWDEKDEASELALGIGFADPVYIYSLREGINDGFLTPFRVKQIATTLDDYVYTPDDQVVEGEVETGKRYTETDFNKIIEIKEREAHRVKLFMDQINQGEKTLVFCATQDHALAVRDLINQMKTSTDPNYCQRVTANDGEPLEPEPCKKCGYHPCQCERKPPQPCAVCGKRPCVCPKEEEEPCPVCGQRPCVCKKRAKVKLADGKERAIQHMVCTTFWHPDGTPISAQQFMELLFGKLPEFFKDE